MIVTISGEQQVLLVLIFYSCITNSHKLSGYYLTISIDQKFYYGLPRTYALDLTRAAVSSEVCNPATISLIIGMIYIHTALGQTPTHTPSSCWFSAGGCPQHLEITLTSLRMTISSHKMAVSLIFEANRRILLIFKDLHDQAWPTEDNLSFDKFIRIKHGRDTPSYSLVPATLKGGDYGVCKWEKGTLEAISEFNLLYSYIIFIECILFVRHHDTQLIFFLWLFYFMKSYEVGVVSLILELKKIEYLRTTFSTYHE